MLDIELKTRRIYPGTIVIFDDVVTKLYIGTMFNDKNGRSSVTYLCVWLKNNLATIALTTFTVPSEDFYVDTFPDVAEVVDAQ